MSVISKLNLQNLAIFIAKCGKFFYFCGKIWQILGFQMAIFRDARPTLSAKRSCSASGVHLY